MMLPILLLSVSENDLKRRFNKTRSMINQENFQKNFEYLASNYPDSYYGQLSMLELAKLCVLKRNYPDATTYLKKINNPKIIDKAYWLAKTYLKLNKNIEAIVTAQNFIYLSNNYDKIEDAYIIIAQAYLQKEYFQKALNTLNTLRKSKYVKNRIALMNYKMAECYEKMGKTEKAIGIYKKIKKEFPYNQYGYRAQDKIQELTSIDDVKIVKEKPIDKAAVSPDKFDLYLQAGAYGGMKFANLQKDKIKKIGLPVEIGKKTKKSGKVLYVVYAGPFKNTEELKKASNKLSDKDIQFFIYKKYHE